MTDAAMQNMGTTFRRWVPKGGLVRTGLLALWLVAGQLAFADSDGKGIFERNCVVCHGAGGTGVPGVFPPLAGSDFLAGNREVVIRGVLQGFKGKITVNGTIYDSVMPAVALPPGEIAAVLSYVFSSWGNDLPAVSESEVAAIAATSTQAVEGLLYPTLPAVPAGSTLRVLAEMPLRPVRMASYGDARHLLVLTQGGDIWMLDTQTGGLTLYLAASAYINMAEGDPAVTGLAIDDQRRLYITVNQKYPPGDKRATNIVKIVRSTPLGAAAAPAPTLSAWFRAQYPYSSSYYNHSVGHIAQGPDGWMYAASGSRTDGGGPDTFGLTEHPFTATMWRLDPRTEPPTFEIYAEGLRNPYGFCWDSRGNMFATENGPDEDAPEEINRIEEGMHYGFPHAFSDWERNPYPANRPLAEGVQGRLPLQNIGPDGGGSFLKPISTLHPHSCPAGMVWLDDSFPTAYRNSLLVARFGHYLKRGTEELGFDLLLVRPLAGSGAREQAEVRTLLTPLARPLDVLIGHDQTIYIAEYCRGTTLAASQAQPGRILALKLADAPTTVPGP